MRVGEIPVKSSVIPIDGEEHIKLKLISLLFPMIHHKRPNSKLTISGKTKISRHIGLFAGCKERSRQRDEEQDKKNFHKIHTVTLLRRLPIR